MHVLSLSTVGSFVPCQFWVEVFWCLRNVLPSPILTGCSYVYGGATWEPQFLGVLQGDLIVDQRVNHAEGSERGNLGVKRGNAVLVGAKLLKIRRPRYIWQRYQYSSEGTSLAFPINATAYAARMANKGWIGCA